MFDLLGPIRKAATILAFITFFIAANAALLYALQTCLAATECIGTSTTAEVVNAIKLWSSLVLPGNAYVCFQACIIGLTMRRAYDYSQKVMAISASAT